MLLKSSILGQFGWKS